ncbi:MAG: hypothetical protein JXA16_11175 [Bacteroidales bacterium]|nr:hypothetical protein [Bacteroidales bacterium]
MEKLEKLIIDSIKKVELKFHSLSQPISNDKLKQLSDRLVKIKDNFKDIIEGANKDFIKVINSKEFANFKEEDKQKCYKKYREQLKELALKFNKDFLLK